MCTPRQPALSSRSDSSASSVMHHSSHPPTRSSAERRIDQAHGAAEDRAVALVAGLLTDVEEVAVGVVEPPEVRRPLPVAVVLRGLHEGHPPVLEERRAVGQEVGLDQVVGVDDADHLGPRVRHGEGVVERAALVAGPVLEVDELHPRLGRTERLDRPPERGVGGVVVDEQDLVGVVVEAEQVLEGRDDQVRQLVVGRDVQADEQPGGEPGGQPLRVDVRGPGAPVGQVDQARIDGQRPRGQAAGRPVPAGGVPRGDAGPEHRGDRRGPPRPRAEQGTDAEHHQADQDPGDQGARQVGGPPAGALGHRDDQQGRRNQDDDGADQGGRKQGEHANPRSVVTLRRCAGRGPCSGREVRARGAGHPTNLRR